MTSIVKFLFRILISLVAAITSIFFLIHLVPGDPAQAVLGEKATPEAIAMIRKQLNLDDPLYLQLQNYFVRLVHGDLGTSIRSGRPVFEEMLARIPATLELSLIALILAAVGGILLGALAARKPGGVLDLFLGAISVFGLSIPIFFLGLLLILVFGQFLNWLPLSGRLSYSMSYEPITGFILLDALLSGDFDLFVSGFSHLVLPAIALATVPLSLLARLTRSSLIEVLRADYIRTARAKGQSEFWIFFKHSLRNAIVPVVTMLGFEFGMLLGGAILTENVFAWPGMGRWIVSAVEGRDFPAVQGAVLFFAAGIIFVMALTDQIHERIDPRLRFKS